MNYSKNSSNSNELSFIGSITLTPKDPDYLTLTGFQSISDAEKVATKLGLMEDQYTIHSVATRH